MPRVVLSERWLDVDGVSHAPGEAVTVDADLGRDLVNGGFGQWEKPAEES